MPCFSEVAIGLVKGKLAPLKGKLGLSCAPSNKGKLCKLGWHPIVATGKQGKQKKQGKTSLSNTHPTYIYL